MDRDEAIEIVREYYPSSGKDLNEALETLIPELKESDDERIRREISKFLKDIHNGSLENRRFIADRYGDAIPDDMIPTWLDWLEKQKDNPRTADSIPLDCASDAKKENRWHKVEDSLPDNNREVLCKDAIGNFFIGRYYNDGDYWEVSMYDEPDKSNKDNPPVMMWANIPSCEQNLANSAKTCKVEQNRAWSEDDEEMLRRCISATFDHGYLKESDWLKSLKERCTWKPSEEQIASLRYAVNNMKSSACYHSPLVHLLQDFENIKE